MLVHWKWRSAVDMNFRTRVSDVFFSGSRTILCGDLVADSPIIRDAHCSLEVDGEWIADLRIGGEMHTEGPERDLWTADSVPIDRHIVASKEVLLISK